MRIFPKEKYWVLNDCIKNIQGEYPLDRTQLAYAARRISQIIEENSRTMLKGELVDGRRYGIFEYSYDATGINRKTGKEYRNHGDLYITCWTWHEKEQTFFCQTAWGGFSEKKPAVIHVPLIELP